MLMNDCFALNGSSLVAEKVSFKLPSATVTILQIDRMGTVEQDCEYISVDISLFSFRLCFLAGDEG
jgi:hypothetical protein